MADLACLAFETVLARLTSESCGLSQKELFRLFCQTVREFFGASGVCCCRPSRQGAWEILESAGHSTWGTREEPLPSTAIESLAQAGRVRKSTVSLRASKDFPWGRGDGGSSQVAVPFFPPAHFLVPAPSSSPNTP